MRKIFLFFVLLIPCLAKAQTTNITLQVTDSGGQSWNNGSWTVTLSSYPGAVPPGPPFYLIGTSTQVPNQTQSGSLSGTGSASITLTQNIGITPVNTRWGFTVCSQATASNNCFTQFVTITSVTTVTLAPPALLVVAGPSALAYTDSEIVNPLIGSVYYNITTNSPRVCNAPTPCTWGAGGGSAFGTPPASPNGVAQSGCVTPPSATLTWCLPGISSNNQTAPVGNAYTLLPSDRGGEVEIGGGSTYTIPDAGSTGFGAGFYTKLTFPATGSGTATINRSSASTFDLEGLTNATAQNTFSMYPGMVAYVSTNSAGNAYRVNVTSMGADFSYAPGTHTLTASSSAVANFGSIALQNGFNIPNGPGNGGSTVPTNGGAIGFNNALAVYQGGDGSGHTFDFALAAIGGNVNQTACTSQFVTKISSNAAPTCSSLGFGASTSQKNETTTPDANVLTFTPPASVGTYRACVVISVSAATSGVISWTLSWTDSNGTAQSNVAQDLFQDGTAAPATSFTTSAAGNYHFCREFDTNAASANVIVKWVGGGTTTAKMSATIEKLI